jgi:hypothetical protein
MSELISEAIALHNLPATLLLALIVGYWLLVLFGIADSDTEPMDLDGDGVADVSSSPNGLWPTCGRFLYLGQVPLMIVVSFMAVSLWVISMISNYYLNGEPGHRSAGVAVLLLIPNALVSLLITRIAATPFRKLFSTMDKGSTEVEAIIDREAIVTTAQVDERYGQVAIATGAAPLLVNARTAPGDPPLLKGTTVRIRSAGPDHAFYFVEPCPSTQPTPSLP